jgi:hypothetical protein
MRSELWFRTIGGGLAMLMGVLIAPARAESVPPLALEATIPLPHTSGRIDHLAIDIGRKRLVVAELGNGTVDIVDLEAKQVVHRLAGLREPQGVLYVPFTDRIAIASAGDGTLRLFSADTFSQVGRLDLGDDADNVRIAADGRDVLVGYGSGGLAVVDPVSGTARQKQLLAAHPEGFQLASDGHVYVNVPDAAGIEVADLKANKRIAIWRFPGVSGNFPMALGEAGTVAVVFRSPPRFIRIEAATGRELSRSAVCGDADDVFFDAKRQRYYVSCGAGVVSVLQVSVTGVNALPSVITSGGARTSLFVPEFDRLFVAVRASLLGSDASIWVMRPEH